MLIQRPRGFTLLEVLVAITIIAIIGGIVVPSVIGNVEAARVTRTADDLKAIRSANNALVASAADRFLGRVSFASINPTSTDTTSCNGLQPAGGTLVVLYAGNASNWTGPYMSRANSRQGGFVTGIGVIRDIVRRTTANGTQGDLVLMIPKVRLEDAMALNDLMDGDGTGAKQSNATGSVRYPLPDVDLIVDSVTYQFAMTENKC
jgi:prepilin-type N-terminal cleavage/methylation domain-containing protein